MAKMTPTKPAMALGSWGEGLQWGRVMELCLALSSSAAPVPWGPDPTFCWCKSLWTPGAGGILVGEREDQTLHCHHSDHTTNLLSLDEGSTTH